MTDKPITSLGANQYFWYSWVFHLCIWVISFFLSWFATGFSVDMGIDKFFQLLYLVMACSVVGQLDACWNPNNIVSTLLLLQHQSWVTSTSFKFTKWSNISIWLLDRTITSTNILGQSGPGSNGNEGGFYIHQSFRTGALPSDYFVSYSGHTLKEGPYRGAIDIILQPHPFGIIFRLKSKKESDIVRFSEYGECYSFSILCFTQNCWSKSIKNG